MNNYPLLFLIVLLASCAANSPSTSSTKVTAPVSNTDLRADTDLLSGGIMALAAGIDKVGKNSDLATTYAAGKKELGPNPYPNSKHYHSGIDVEHSHGNPGSKHDPMAMSASSSHLYYFDHFHEKQAPHNHFVPMSMRHNHRK